MSSPPDISVLIPTFNRAEILERTLEAFERLDTSGLSHQIVVIDNNSTDGTKRVASSFAERLPLVYVFEAKAGKSSALNKALGEVELGELVVFADDDIEPNRDWLQEIARVSAERTEFSVFGGRTYIIWPVEQVPAWADRPGIRFWAFGDHDRGEEVHPYPPRNYPGGANFWIRRACLDRGARFDEHVGPRPAGYQVMGTETAFLYLLSQQGDVPLYVPTAVVGHRVQPALLELDYVRGRAYRWGRGQPRRGLCHPDLLARRPRTWRCMRRVSLARNTLKYWLAKLLPVRDLRIETELQMLTRMGYDHEALKLADERRQESA